jgi:hypothetical protein
MTSLQCGTCRVISFATVDFMKIKPNKVCKVTRKAFVFTPLVYIVHCHVSVTLPIKSNLVASSARHSIKKRYGNHPLTTTGLYYGLKSKQTWLHWKKKKRILRKKQIKMTIFQRISEHATVRSNEFSDMIQLKAYRHMSCQPLKWLILYLACMEVLLADFMCQYHSVDRSC